MKKLLLLLITSLHVFGFSQTLSSNLSSKDLKIGQTGVLRLHISQLNNHPVDIAGQNEIMPFGFNVIEDSIGEDNNSYNRVVKFQVPQAGNYTIPAIQVRVGDKTLNTTPYKITVTDTENSTVQSPAQPSEPVTASDEISDIKPNTKVKMGIVDYWSLYKTEILLVLATIIAAFLLFKIVKSFKKKKAVPVVASNRTLKLLESLKKKGYIEKNDYRSYYVELIDIFRGFLADRYNFPARELLSDDLVDYLSSQKILDEENHKTLSDLFERGDLAKFAKIIPTADDMKKDFGWTKTFVKQSLKDWLSENAEANE